MTLRLTFRRNSILSPRVWGGIAGPSVASATGEASKRERGGYTGGPRLARRFGWRLEAGPDGKREYVPLPKERKELERMRAEYESGASLRAIAEGLNAARVRTTTGGRWSRQGVAAVLRREGVELRGRGRPRKGPGR